MAVSPAAAGASGAVTGSRPAAPEVSVVVPYYRAQRDLDRLLAALAAQDHPAARLQLVLADDGSPEPPRVPADVPFDVVTVRQEDRGFRASAARALGARVADGRVLAFLDGDMLPEPGYLAAASTAPAARPDAAVVGRRRHVTPSLVDSGWRPGQHVPAEALLDEPAWLRDAYAATGNLARADATAYRFVISAVLTVAREVYEDAGGFDPEFVGYGGEDWELAHRLWRVGAVLRHEPAAVAWQAGGDFGARTDPAEARRVKNRESLVLASRIAAPTARGRTLSLGGPLRVGARVRGKDSGPAALVLGVDAALQAFPAARVGVTGLARDDDAAAAARVVLADPRVWVMEGPAGGSEPGAGPGNGVDPDPDAVPGEGADPARDALPPTPARGDLAGVRGLPDWSMDVRVPLRPAGAGRRPDPSAAADWLLRLERAGVERVEVLGERGEQGDEADRGVPLGDAAARSVFAVLTSSRALWRDRRGAEVGSGPSGGAGGRTLRVPVARLGWQAVQTEPDLEAWWGGWG